MEEAHIYVYRTWNKPELGWLKLNIDTAIFQDGNIGVGFVFRDAQRRFVAVSCKKGKKWRKQLI